MSEGGPVNTPKVLIDLAGRTVELACRERNRAAIAMLYEEHRKQLGRRLFALVNDREAAYDLYQETFIRVWQSISPEVEPFFQQWLYTIARNLAIDYLRRAQRITFLPLPEDEEDGSIDYGPSLYDRMTDKADHMLAPLILGELLAGMSPQYRTCLVLQFHWGYTQREIAVMLGISEKAVSANISRGYQQARRLYTKMVSDLLDGDDQGTTGKGAC